MVSCDPQLLMPRFGEQLEITFSRVCPCLILDTNGADCMQDGELRNSQGGFDTPFFLGVVEDDVWHVPNGKFIRNGKSLLGFWWFLVFLLVPGWQIFVCKVLFANPE